MSGPVSARQFLFQLIRCQALEEIALGYLTAKDIEFFDSLPCPGLVLGGERDAAIGVLSDDEHVSDGYSMSASPPRWEHDDIAVATSHDLYRRSHPCYSFIGTYMSALNITCADTRVRTILEERIQALEDGAEGFWIKRADFLAGLGVQVYRADLFHDYAALNRTSIGKRLVQRKRGLVRGN